MALTVDWVSRIVDSTSSISDIVEFKDAIRDIEDNADGILYPPIITYKALSLGGGAYQHGVDFINGYQLRFPSAGNYTIMGNINATVVPVAGVFVDRTKSVAFAVTSAGGSGYTPSQIADAVWDKVIP